MAETMTEAMKEKIPGEEKGSKKSVFLTNHSQEEQRRVAAAPTSSLAMVTTMKPITPPQSLNATSCEVHFVLLLLPIPLSFVIVDLLVEVYIFYTFQYFRYG